MTPWTLPMLRVRPPPEEDEEEKARRKATTRKKRRVRKEKAGMEKENHAQLLWQLAHYRQAEEERRLAREARRRPQQQWPQRRQQRQKDRPSTPANQHCHCGRFFVDFVGEHWVTHVLRGWGEVLSGYWSGNAVTGPGTHAITRQVTHAVRLHPPTGPVTGLVPHAVTSLLHIFVHSFQDQPTAEGHGAAQGHDAPEIEPANVPPAEVNQEAPVGGELTVVAAEIPE